MFRPSFRRFFAIASVIAVLLLVAGGVYALGFDLNRVPPGNPAATAADLGLLSEPPAPRGRLLAIVSSAPTIPGSARRAGFELTELSRAYYVFTANGYAVDIASPQGGRPPVVVDDDLTDVDYAFLNDPVAQLKTADTLRLDAVDPSRYAGVYVVGGKGAMVDLADHPEIARIVLDIDRRGGVIGAVCHGPAALLGIRRDDGRLLVDGRRLTGFSNAEELFLIENARELFPFLLQDRLRSEGADYVEGPMYLDNTVVDGRLVSGQNPWATWSVADAMIRALGQPLVARPPTGEERAVQVLTTYRRDGYDAARALRDESVDADVRLLLLHALIAAMQGELHHAFQLQRLAHG